MIDGFASKVVLVGSRTAISAPAEHHVYSLGPESSALQRSAMCFYSIALHAAPDGAENQGSPSYKHFAPLEQRQAELLGQGK